MKVSKIVATISALLVLVALLAILLVVQKKITDSHAHLSSLHAPKEYLNVQTPTERDFLIFLYGSYDEGSETASWHPSTSELEKISKGGYDYTTDTEFSASADNPNPEPFLVSVLATSTDPLGRYELLTYAQGCMSQVCGAVIGGFELSYVAGKGWHVTASNKVIDVMGQAGDPNAEVTPLKLTSAVSGFKVVSNYQMGDDVSGGLYIMAPIGTSFEEIFAFDDAYGNNGDVVEDNPLYSYESTMKLLPASQSDVFPMIEILKKGTVLDFTTAEVSKINNRYQYSFVGGLYKQNMIK